VVKIEGLAAMLKYAILSPPALVIDGQVKFSGQLLSAAKIKENWHSSLSYADYQQLIPLVPYLSH
jgi:hypothetical protein